VSNERTIDALVVGEALIDIVETGRHQTAHVGGSPANVALGLGRLGRSVTLLTQLGDDRYGEQIRDHLAESHVMVSAPTPSHRTSTATARLQPGGNALYDFEIAWETLPAHEAVEPRIIHTGSIATFLKPGADSVRDLLREFQGSEITFDPNVRAALVGEPADAVRTFENTAQLCTVVKMSDEDAGFLYPGSSPHDALDAVLSLGARLAIVTLGAGGAILATPQDRVRVEASPVTVADTIGAGDTFMASVIDTLLTRPRLGPNDLLQMGQKAALLAGITVSRAGADLPWAQEYILQ
jgi:fructokinase